METTRLQATVLHADVHGYSVHMGQDEAETFRRLAIAIELFRRLIGDFNGRVVNAVGDSILAVFDNTASALGFATAFQEDWAKGEAWRDGNAPLRFRIGLHRGEVGMAGEVVYGQTVNIAARLQLIAPPGGICVSASVRAVGVGLDQVWRPLGPVQLHNIDVPVPAFIIERHSPHHDDTDPAPIDPASPLGPEPSLVLLPLRTTDQDPADRQIADGTAGDIIAALTRFRELVVIARHSAFQFRNEATPVAHVARCLGVRYIATGTLQRNGGRLRLSFRLEEADGGRILWAERFDGSLADIFAFQEEVAATIASRLVLAVRQAETQRRSRDHVPVLGAYGLILRGQDLSLRFRRESNLHSRRLFQAAVELDPTYGRAYAALSRSHNYEWRYAWTSQPERGLEQALRLAHEAVQRDEADARGYAELGYAHLYRKEHDAALAAYERALCLNPNDADILVEYADALVYNNEAQRAVALIEQAMRLNPLYPDWYLWFLADAYDALGRSQDVIATVHRMRNPDEGRRLLAANYAHLGRFDEARQEADAVLRLHPDFTVQGWAKRPPYRYTDLRDRFMEGLRRAGLPSER